MRLAFILFVGAALLGCSEGSDNSVHCFDQNTRGGGSSSLTAFTQTNCPTIADTVTTSPPTATTGTTVLQ